MRAPLFICFLILVAPLAGQPEIDMVMPATALPNGDPRPADLDGDGDLDLVFGPGFLSYVNPHLYWMENQGNRQFSELKLLSLSLMPDDTVWRASEPLDFDGDGDKEFLVDVQTPNGWSSGEPPPVHQPYLFDPDTGLASLALFEGNEDPWYAVDLDDDGLAEIVQFQGEWDESWAFHVHRRQPDGSYGKTTSIELVTDRLELDPVARMEMIDLDNDGDLDLSLQFDYGYHVILRRTGIDSFDPTPVIVEGTDLNASWADLDGDGRKDLLTWNLGWMKNMGNLDFELQPRIPSADLIYPNGRLFQIVEQPGAKGLFLGYLITAGGEYELIRTPYDAPEIQLSQTLAYQGDQFQSSRYPIFWADLDGNGYQDLILRAGNSSYTGDTIAVAWGDVVSFSAATPLRNEVVIPAPLVEDFNTDGAPDLIVGPDLDGFFRLALNGRTGGFSEFRKMEELHQTLAGDLLVPRRIVGAADFDGDGVADLAVDYVPYGVAGAAPVPALFIGRADGTFTPLSSVPTPLLDVLPYSLGSSFAEFVDWDSDGDLDIITLGSWIENDGGSFRTGNPMLIALGEGTDFLGNPIPLGFTVTGDLDDDGHPDIVSAFQGFAGSGTIPPDSEVPHVVVGFNDGSGNIEESRDLAEALAGNDLLGNPGLFGDVRIADVDSDGLPDLCTRSIEGFDAIGMPVLVGRWRKNPGQGSRDIESWAIMPFPDGPLPGRHFSDFDGDGNEEWVAFANYLKPSPSGPVRSDEFNFVGDADFSSYKVQAIEDFDNDGDADFLLGGTGYNPLVLLKNPLVDHHDPLVARMREAGIAGALSGMTNDADDDGRDNFTELTQGTNLLSPEASIQNPYLMNLEVDGSVAILAYRVPWRAVGLGSAEAPVSLSELGIQFSIDSSPDLIDWETSDRSSGIMVFSDGTWNYFAKGYVRADAACYFRLRSSP